MQQRPRLPLDEEIVPAATSASGTISLVELTKPQEKTSKNKQQRPARPEVSIASLRDAIRMSLSDDLAAPPDAEATDGPAEPEPGEYDATAQQQAPAPELAKPVEDGDEDEYYDRDRSQRSH